MKTAYYITTSSGSMRKQNGAVLIVSLILLIVMTLLGLSTMNKAGMQEKMASNNQERVRAFQAAETGISVAFNSGEFFNVNNPVDSTGKIGEVAADYSQTDYAFQTSYLSKSIPYRGTGWDPEFFSFYNFNIASSGKGAGGSSSLVNAGIYQIGSK